MNLFLKGGKMNWDDLNSEKSYEPRVAYNQSKLCNILFTRELAERLRGTKVTAVSLHPGVVRTELGRYFADSYGWKAYVFQVLFLPIIYWWFKSSKQGAQTSLHCAIEEDVDAHSGSYYFDCQVKALLPHALNDDDARRLWELSEKLTKLK
jgi:NAD(P)-dependent dehydrogenase (short-subunit alcohol dehydrogenase family)